MLREISNRMEMELGEQFEFFRLDGVHFLVLTQLDYDSRVLSDTIREIVLDVYRAAMGSILCTPAQWAYCTLRRMALLRKS